MSMEFEQVDNSQLCKEHEGHERIMFCNEHKVWICDVCLKNHKKCKGGTLHYTEIIELCETGNLKQTHLELTQLSNELANCLSRTKNEFINIIDDYQANLSKSLNLNLDYNNKNRLQLAMQCFRYKQSNEEVEYNKFYQHLVDFIQNLENSKENFKNYKIIREQEGFITPYNIDLLREWTGIPKMNVELIFKASRDGFKALEFHSKCTDDVTPSIIIAKTQFGKLIGGYTEIPWKVAATDYEVVPDKTGKTFLFSLDLKEKYIPKDPKYCISHSRNSGPIFGCKYTKKYGPMISATFIPDFEIVNECNVNKCTFNEIGKNFCYAGLKDDFFGSDKPLLIEDYEMYRVLYSSTEN